MTRPLRIAFALSHIQYYRHFDSAIRGLCAAGHQVVVVTNQFEKPNLTDRSIRQASKEIQGVSFEKPLGRRDLWKYLIRPVRELINYSIYFRPGHPSPNMARLWRPNFSKFLWWIVGNLRVGKFLAQDQGQRVLRGLEYLVPASGMVTRWLRLCNPDVLVVSPLVGGKSSELEYLKAAKALNIPTVYALASWDNLTTKGTFLVQPDLVLVWNEALLEEAVTLHGIPRENIVITGAPTFDYWFERRSARNRNDFCRALEFDPDRKYVVFLCTSRGMIEDEETLILDIAAAMRNRESTKDLMLLVRPHPYNILNLGRLDAPNIRVYPKGGDWPDVDEAKQTYYETLHYASATIGINTSAMIESAIVDIPCVTIIDDRYRRWQTEMGHFWHLIKGDFLDVQYSYDAAVASLGDILRGEDIKCEQRRRFVKDFVRPLGLDRPVSPLFSSAIRMAADRKSAADIRHAIQPTGALA